MNILEIALFTLIGIALGIVSGLLPGIHVNTISAFILAILPTLSQFSTVSIVVAIVSMAIVNSFLSFIPSILLGAPDSETVLSVLPGHRMLLNGEAIEAIKLTGIGSLIALIVVLGTFYISIISIEPISQLLRNSMHYILIFVTLIGILLEEKPISATGIFVLTGVFGLLTLQNFSNEIVFPALSGLFGISTLLLSVNSNTNIPVQNKSTITVDKLSIIKNSLLGSFAGAIVGFLPGIGAAQATFLVQQVNGKQTEKEFLISNAAVSVGNTLFPLFVFYALGKTRSGVAIAMKELVGGLTFDLMLLILIVSLIVGIISYFLHIKIGMILTNFLINNNPENYNKISIAVIIFLIAMTFLLTGVSGLLVLALGTLIGLLPQLLGVRRAQCMGFFVLPTILYYAGLSAVLLKLVF